MQYFQSAKMVFWFLLTWQLASQYPDLAELRWHKRVVVISAPDASEKQLLEQERIVAANSEGFGEREIQLVRVVGNGPEAERFRARLKIDRVSFAVLLIGKDGSVKLRGKAPLGAEELFRTIDAMPMRREEMKRLRPDRKD